MSTRVAVTTSSFAQFSRQPLALLEAHGLHVTLNPLGRTLTAAEAAEQLRGCCGVIAGTEPLSRRVLEALPELRVISRCGTGMGAVDAVAARELGIQLCNTPDAPTQAVAELTLGVLLDVLRQVSRMDRELRAGIWKKRMGGLLCGKHVGIIGMGRIGTAVARLCAAFGAQVACTDPDSTRGTAFQRLPLEDLLRRSDIVSLHCPLPAQNTGTPPPSATSFSATACAAVPPAAGFPAALLGARELALLPQGALLLNLARGGLVDEQALAEMLRTGRLGGAALDVYAQEPYNGPLRALDNVVLTPHCASYAREARIAMEMEAARNLLAALKLPETPPNAQTPTA